jgi:SNF2 family DNA or RNA helicase
MTVEAIADDVQVSLEAPADSLTMREFLETFGADLMDKAAALYPPVLEDNEPTLPQGLRRMPKGGQAGALAALKVGLERHRQTFLVAEPGTGKTFMSITAATMANCRRVLVICPPHLTEKWAREVGLTVDQPAYIIGSITDLEAVRNREGFFILSRERAKLGPHWKPAVMLRRFGRERQCCCPNCGESIMDKGIPMSLAMLERKKFKCESCRSPLWSVDRAGPRRVALAEYISRKLPRGFFDLFVLDEAHEAKSGNSAQGISAGRLAEHAKRTLVMTGTLFGGYASTLFYLLWRFNDAIRERYKITDEKRFIEDYGLVERIVTHERLEDGRTSSRRNQRVTSKERPGVNPKVLADLLGSSVFLRLSDLEGELPHYAEFVLDVEMDRDQREIHCEFSNTLMAEVRRALARNDKRLLGKAMMALLHHPDTPYREERVKLEDASLPDGEWTVAQALPMPADRIYPKERALLEYVLEQRADHRKVLVYVQGTERRDITGRLAGLLELHGLRAMVLKADTVGTREREAFVLSHQDGVDVLICHPRLVQTGLDLYAFPSIVFYQTEYSTYTLRQAARRSFRIGQTEPVEVVHFAYRETAQLPALKLIAAKAQKSLALEGELVETGLTNLADDDVLLALARSLLTNNEGTTSLVPLPRREARAIPAIPAIPVLETVQPVRATLEVEPSSLVTDQPREMPLFSTDRDLKFKAGRRTLIVPAGALLLFPLEELLAS